MTCAQCGEKPRVLRSRFCGTCRYNRLKGGHIVCVDCRGQMNASKKRRCPPCLLARRNTREPAEKVCPCGKTFQGVGKQKCHFCRKGGRDAYLLARRMEREKAAARMGRTLLSSSRAVPHDVQFLKDEAAKRKAEQKTKRHGSAIAALREEQIRRLLSGLNSLARHKQNQEYARHHWLLVLDDPKAMAANVRHHRRYHGEAAYRDKAITSTRANSAIRARRMGCTDDGTLTKRVHAVIYNMISSCPYCTKYMPIGARSLDHVTPLSKGGAHSIFNVVICCRSCNSGKRDREVPVDAMARVRKQNALLVDTVATLNAQVVAA